MIAGGSLGAATCAPYPEMVRQDIGSRMQVQTRRIDLVLARCIQVEIADIGRAPVFPLIMTRRQRELDRQGTIRGIVEP